jgi:hypothetical protein
MATYSSGPKTRCRHAPLPKTAIIESLQRFIARHERKRDELKLEPKLRDIAFDRDMNALFGSRVDLERYTNSNFKDSNDTAQ